MLPFLCQKSDPDSRLVSAARAGDVHAFDTLVCRHQAALLRFLRARVSLDLDPHDIAQDTFVAAWHGLPNFSGRCQFKTWLLGISLKLSANATRRNRSARMHTEADLQESQAGSGIRGDGGSREWTAVLDRLELRHALVTLPESWREVLELYYYAELNLREISQLLGVNLSTIKYWFVQSHRRLRVILTTETTAPPLVQSEEPR